MTRILWMGLQSGLFVLTSARHVGEHLTELLDRIESAKKPLMVARVFQAYADKTINARMLHRLTSMIERVPFYAIEEVRVFAAKKSGEPTTLGAGTVLDLVNCGLASIGSTLGGLSYSPTDLCSEFLRLDLDK